MITRTVSGLIGGLLVLMVIFFNERLPFLVNFFIAAVCALACFELYSTSKLSKNFKIVIPGLIFSTILPLFGHGLLWKISWYIYTLAMLLILIFSRKSLNFKDVAAIYGMTLLITFSLTTIIDLRTIGGIYSNFYIILALCIPWLADTGAYFCGTLFGKTKLCPDLSPHKTVEGAFGGIIFCILTNLLISLFFKIFSLPKNVDVNYLYVALLAFVGALISIIGDLFFSMIKRCYHVKDFGSVVPGHGGILDRFDSVILVSPFIYFMLKNFDVLLKI